MAKKLLEESTVRRFMKIAGLQPLSENFVQELEEEVVEEMYKEEEPGMEAGEAEAGPDMPEPEDMPSPEAPEAPEAPEGDEEVEMDMGEDDKVELLQKLAKALGVDVEVEEEGGEEEGGEEEGGEEEGGEEPAGELEAPEGEEMMEEGEHMEEPAKAPDGDNLESPELADGSDTKDPNQNPSMKEQDPMKASGQHMAESKEAFKKRLVEEVAKRVAARLKELK